MFTDIRHKMFVFIIILNIMILRKCIIFGLNLYSPKKMTVHKIVIVARISTFEWSGQLILYITILHQWVKLKIHIILRFNNILLIGRL